MTDKCQCFPLNFQKNSWLFHSRDNIDPCYKHFCLPFPQSVERKLFQFWRGNAIRGMETLSRVKIIFSKKRGLFEDFEFWKFAFSSFLPSFRLFRFAQLVKIFFKWSRIDTNRLVQFCLTKLWINERAIRTPLKEITIEKENLTIYKLKIAEFLCNFVFESRNDPCCSWKSFQTVRGYILPRTRSRNKSRLKNEDVKVT